MGDKTMKDALYETVLAALSSDAQIRANAEQQMKLLQVTEEYGIHLMEIMLDKNVTIPVRQLCSVLLKQYIECHWESESKKFEPPQVTQPVKQRLRSQLVAALGPQPLVNDTGNIVDLESSPEKRLRSSIAYAVSKIAQHDWPDEWPELFTILIEFMSNGNVASVYSAMKVFTEVCNDVSEMQIPYVAPPLLQKMYEVFILPQLYSVRTRSRAIQVFSSLVETIALMGDVDKNAISKYLDPVVPHMCEALVKALLIPDTQSELVDVGLKKEVITALTQLLRCRKKFLTKWLPQILSPVWNNLTESAKTYTATKVTCSEDGDTACFPVDSDGEMMDLESLIYALFDFVTVLVESPKLRKQYIKTGITDLIYYLIFFLQITEEQAMLWTENPDQFVEDEDDDSFAYSVRASALDLILSLSQEFEENEDEATLSEFCNGVVTGIKKQLNENVNNWKIQESCLLVLGSLAPLLIESIKNDTPPAADLMAMLDSIFSYNFLELSPFLGGRSLWTASRYSSILSESFLKRFLDSTLIGLRHTSPIIKISAIRACYSFCEHLKSTNSVDTIKPHVSSLMEEMVATGTQFGSEVLALSLDALTLLASVDKEVTAAHEAKLAPLAIGSFLKYSSDPVLISATQDLFRELSRNELTVASLQQRLLPTLISILQPRTSSTQESVLILQPVSLDIMETLVKYSPTPLSPALINEAFPAVVRIILSTNDDSAVLQNGGEAVRAFVSKSVEQVAGYIDPESGQNGISLVLHVCLHLLDQRISESCAAFVGKLVSIAIIKGANYLGPDNVHLLLRSVLTKLQTSEMLSVVQSLILVFAQLVHYDMGIVLEFLSSLPGPTGTESALEFVMTQWLTRQHLFYGYYEKRVSLVALCKIMEYAIASANNTDGRHINLNHVKVPGEEIIADSSPGIRTRSKAKNQPSTWTSVPLPVKILKVVLNELKLAEEMAAATDDDEDYETDEADTSSELDSSPLKNISGDQVGVHDPAQQLAKVLADITSTDDDDEDEDVKSDPLYKVELVDHLKQFVLSFKTSPFASEFVPMLNQTETTVLEKL